VSALIFVCAAIGIVYAIINAYITTRIN